MKTEITYLSGVEDIAQALNQELHGMFTMYLNDDQVAQIVIRKEKDAETLCNDIESFLSEYEDVRVEIKNDGDFLGVIVDVWEDDECIDTACFWFEDYDSEFHFI